MHPFCTPYCQLEPVFSCAAYRRQPLLGTPRRRDLFLTVLEQVRRRYRFVVVGYVVMPEHIHIPIGEPGSFRAYFLGEPGPVKVNDWEVRKMQVRPPVA